MPNKYERDLQILIQAAHAGGEVLQKYFGQAMNMTEKSTVADFQTEADLGSEKIILEILKTNFPAYNIISEEEGKIENGSDHTLVIDPLDGTNNFMLGLPNFSVSIGLLHKNEAIAGVVYQPITDQTYTAVKGAGAYLNDKLIKVNGIIDTERITIAHGCGYVFKPDYLAKMLASLTSCKHKRILHNWSVAYDYCMLASGKIESCIADGIEVHDFAAGKLIALEAGAKLIDFKGAKENNYTNTSFIISNTEEINKYILNIIKPLQEGR